MRGPRAAIRCILALSAFSVLGSGCAPDAGETQARVANEPELLMFSPEWCLRRQADLAAGKAQPEPGAEKLRVDGICSATLQTRDQPLR